MAYRTITTLIHDPEAGTSALEAAIALSSAQGAHLNVICLGMDRTDPGIYYAGAQAVALHAILHEAQATAALLESRVTERLNHESIPWEAKPVTVHENGLFTTLANQMRFSDLAVLPAPYSEASLGEDATAVEAALFGADIPVLVVPDGAEMPPRFAQVMLGWDEGDEALAAARAALPVIAEADMVEIAIIDPPRHGGDRSDPGGRLARFIARHGGQAEVAVLARSEPGIADILSKRAMQKGVDLIIMGAYGHSRLREAILGGATRNMLRDAKVPVLMAR